MKDISVYKKNLEIGGIVLLSIFFIFDGIQKLLDTSPEVRRLDTKLTNLEAWIHNHGFLLFKFAFFIKKWSTLIIYIVGGL